MTSPPVFAPAADTLACFRATEQLASTYATPDARRACWRGAAHSRRKAAECATDPADYRLQMELARRYEERAAAE